MAHVKMEQWKVIRTVVILDELEVEVLTCVDSENLHVCICKGLAKTDSTTSIEGSERVHVALLSTRCEAQLVVGVKPLWPEGIGITPLVRVVLQHQEVDTDLSVCLDVVLPHFCVFAE